VSEPAEDSTKPCAYCGSPIPRSAILCSVCKSYQSTWRNNFAYWAGFAGLIGLLGSAVAYIISELPSLRKVIAWNDELQVVEFGATDTRNFTVSANNVGDGTVILSSIVIFLKNGNENAGYVIDKVLDANRLLSESFNVKEDAQGMAPQIPADYDLFIANTSGKPNSTTIQRSQIIYSFNSSTWPCFLKVPANATSEGQRRMEQAYSTQGRHLVTEPLQAFAIYFSAHSGKKIRTPFPAVAAFMRSTKPECRALNYND
jgi:hypothetical protein